MVAVTLNQMAKLEKVKLMLIKIKTNLFSIAPL